MLCKGDKSENIAGVLSISPVTVRVHTKNILKKLNLSGLSELVKLRNELLL